MSGLECAVCGVSFATRNARAQHERRTHPEWKASPELAATRRREVISDSRVKPESVASRQRWIEAHPEQIHDYERKYREGHRAEAHARTRAYKATPTGREKARRRRQADIAAGRHSARMAVLRAIQRSDIKKQPCQKCGAERVEAHHHLGYDRAHWLDVQWLCRAHHEQVHHGSGASEAAA